jgi:hypothetical protein
MKTMNALIRRNIKLFFKDKAMFFTSLITPLILLVLYTTFLSNVYKDSFMAAIPGACDSGSAGGFSSAGDARKLHGGISGLSLDQHYPGGGGWRVGSQADRPNLG